MPDETKLPQVPNDAWVQLADDQPVQAHPMLGLLEPGKPVPVGTSEPEKHAAACMVAMKAARFVTRPKPEPKPAPKPKPEAEATKQPDSK